MRISLEAYLNFSSLLSAALRGLLGDSEELDRVLWEPRRLPDLDLDLLLDLLGDLDLDLLLDLDLDLLRLLPLSAEAER